MSVSKILLSIIVPVYNVESFVAICLQSILNSTDNPTDFELIIVNDGTLDNSMSIVKEIVSVHRNVQILEQENQGLSVARMNGLKMAQGEYIWFVDSDDWLESNAIGTVLKSIGKIHPDVIVTPLNWRFSDSNNDYLDININCDKVYGGRECLFDGVSPAFAAQRFIIKKQLFKDSDWLFFPSNLFHEDEYFGRVLLYSADLVYVLKDPLYNYRQRENSIMGSITVRNAYDLVEIHKLLMRFLKKEVYAEDQIWYRRDILKGVLLVAYYRCLGFLGTKEFYKFLFRNRMYVAVEYLRTKPRKTNKKKLGDLAFIFFPHIYSKYMGIRYSI